MRTAFALALVGDHNPFIPAHRAIPVALAMAATFHQVSLSQTWIATSKVDSANVFSAPPTAFGVFPEAPTGTPMAL